METRQTIQLALLVFGMSIGVAAQNAQTPAETTPAPAMGQSAPVLNPENPPVTGLDEPGLDLHPASRSFISPALQASESADTNAENDLGTSSVSSVARVIGALDLQQFWPKSDLILEYLGGGAFYSSPSDVKQMEAFGLEAVTRWRTGQVTLRDAFSYLPDGSFELGFGGNPGLGIATSGGIGSGESGGGLPGTHVFGTGQFGAVGNIPRLTNTAILDAVQAINPVSAFTVAGGFSNAHFYDSADCTNNPLLVCLINSDQVTIEGGYSHLMNRHDQIGLVYAYQVFQFPQLTGGSLYVNVLNLRYSHSITGRMSFVVGAGPEYTELEQGGYASTWSLSARAQLRYKLNHASIVASYEKYTSSGSGFYAGSNVQAARLGYTRPLGRTWDLYADLGYSHNTPVQNTPGSDLGVSAFSSSYNEGSAGFILRKHLGREYDFFAAYHFSELGLDGIHGVEQRQVGTVGVEWHPRPTRIE